MDYLERLRHEAAKRLNDFQHFQGFLWGLGRAMYPQTCRTLSTLVPILAGERPPDVVAAIIRFRFKELRDEGTQKEQDLLTVVEHFLLTEWTTKASERVLEQKRKALFCASVVPKPIPL